MKLKELYLNAAEYATDGFWWLGRKLGFKQEDLSKTYAGRQMGMRWVDGFNRHDMFWLNRLHKKLEEVDGSVRENEPSVHALIDRCLKLGLCSQRLYMTLRLYARQKMACRQLFELCPATNLSSGSFKLSCIEKCTRVLFWILKLAGRLGLTHFHFFKFF